MSDAKDHPERNTHKQVSEEIKAINFEWTPELVKLGTSRGSIHPSIGPIEQSDGFPNYIYRPGMALPDPADTRECLKWVGLSDEKIIEVEEKFSQLYPDYQAPSCGYDEEHSRNGLNSITFPVIDKIVDVFIKGLDAYTDDFEYTHEGYIKKGIQQGLRPEFAIFCGLHKDDPRAINDPFLFKEDWFSKGPEDIIVDFIVPFWTQLQMFMTLKLIHEEKTWKDDRGKWLVHEGENLDQAKARVDDRELQRLREQATEEYEAKREQERQELARLTAEEDARFEEEERREAEMLKERT